MRKGKKGARMEIPTHARTPPSTLRLAKHVLVSPESMAGRGWSAADPTGGHASADHVEPGLETFHPRSHAIGRSNKLRAVRARVSDVVIAVHWFYIHTAIAYVRMDEATTTASEHLAYSSETSESFPPLLSLSFSS